MARDLHDEVNQALTAILLRLEALAHDLPPERATEVAELKRLASQAMDELLSLARQLRPTALDDHGLVPGHRGPAARLRRAHGRRGHAWTPSGDPGALDEEKQTVIYRVAQEALANAGRHARAARIDVELDAGARGRRAQRPRRRPRASTRWPPAATAGWASTGMAERARLVGGELDLRSSPGAGTEVTLRLP